MKNPSQMPGRKCGWCGKPGGTCSSLLKARCDRAGVKLKGDSQRYFHGGKCTSKVRAACEKAERAAGNTIQGNTK